MRSSYAHHLGKSVRKRIIQELIAEHGNRKLAEMLGISPAAISKYASGAMHPSDITMSKALMLARGRLREKIARLIVNDLTKALVEALDEFDEEIEWNDSLEELYLLLNRIRPQEVRRTRKRVLSFPSSG